MDMIPCYVPLWSITREEEIWVNANLVRVVSSHEGSGVLLWFDEHDSWLVDGPAANVAYRLANPARITREF